MPETVLVCSDGRCAVSDAACGASRLLSTLRSETDSALEVPTPDFCVAVTSAAVEFLEHHLAEPFAEIEPPLKQSFEDTVSTWDRSFLTSVQQRGPHAVPELLTLSCYLDIPDLRSLCAAFLASSLQNCSDGDVFGLVGVESITEEEIERSCANFPWLRP